MLIRRASPFDITAVLEMLRAYREKTTLDWLHEVEDAEYITALLFELMAGKGLILLADNDSNICGMLIAGISASVWSPKHLLMKELAYWVNTNSRHSSAGYRLLAEYTAYGKVLKTEGRIVNFTISKMVNSPNLKYDRFGYQKFEEFWVI